MCANVRSGNFFNCCEKYRISVSHIYTPLKQIRTFGKLTKMYRDISLPDGNSICCLYIRWISDENSK